MVAYVHEFLSALVFTLTVEIALLFFLLRVVYRQKEIYVKQIFSAGMCASTLTIPYVWFVFPFIVQYPLSVVASELFAFVVEGVFYRTIFKISFKQSFIISLVANFASYTLGQAIRI